MDDHPSNIKALQVKLASEGYEVITAESGKEAVEKFETDRPDLVLLDVMMPTMDGFETCRLMKQKQGSDFIPVIMVTARTDSDSMVKGFEIGADDYVTKPFQMVELIARVRSMLRIQQIQNENRALRRELRTTHGFDKIIGQSPAMKRVFDLVDRVLEREITVLITGKTGTGKEAIARTIHYNGTRANGRFVAANCGAFSEGLLESELFGHKKGSFTGAAEDRVGLFESANGGTVFLDEISETSPGMQVKLLRVLQESEIVRVGEVKARKIDVRIIAATNKDLDKETRNGSFREDLFYRLSVFPIPLPSLAERPDDIPLLADHFLKKHRSAIGVSCPGFTNEALDRLNAYSWPGNVRELENEIQRALVLVPGRKRIGLNELSPKLRSRSAGKGRGEESASLKEALEVTESEWIERVFEKHDGNKSRMAKELGMSRWTLLKKMRFYGFEPGNS